MPTRLFHRRKFENPPRTRCGLKGVIEYPWLKRKRWKAYLRQSGMYVCLGYYASKEEAAAAYNRKARQLFGPTAYQNPL